MSGDPQLGTGVRECPACGSANAGRQAVRGTCWTCGCRLDAPPNRARRLTARERLPRGAMTGVVVAAVMVEIIAGAATQDWRWAFTIALLAAFGLFTGVARELPWYDRLGLAFSATVRAILMMVAVAAVVVFAMFMICLAAGGMRY
jgi:hypothetical protein